MSEPGSIPFSKWEGEHVRHLTVSPDGSVYVVPSGAHERLHRIIIGESTVGEQFDGPSGTKVELALAGWVQLQSDQLIDRVNVDAPDGFDQAELVRTFAKMHEAGSIAVAFHPSGKTLTSTIHELALPGNGDRVPVPLENEK